MNRVPYVIYGLRSTYLDLGNYELKVVLDKELFKSSHASEIQMSDSDGRPMRCEVNRWGRKMNCVFTIDASVSDGVSLIRLSLRDDSGNVHNGRATFWVVKP